MVRIVVALLASLLLASPAGAQQAEDRSVLLILDGSEGIAGSAGGGLDVAEELLEAAPEDARVGLRVYGARSSGAAPARGCRDSGLQARGGTSIGRALLAARGDFAASGRRTVILVAGAGAGDDCASPDPCRAAAQAARQGIDLQVVGLRVNERARRHLRCIAEAGGGSYVDAGDADRLEAELRAAFARALRPYEPTGTPIEGGARPAAAAAAAPGQYLDTLSPARARWYAIDVEKGQRLLAAATVIAEPPPAPDFQAVVRVELQDPQGRTLFEDVEIHRTLGGRAPVGTFAAAMERPAPGGGTYRFGVSVSRGLNAPLPMEVVLSAAGGEQQAGPGARAGAGGGTPRVRRSSDVPELAGVGAAGLLLGGLAGLVARRRRR